MEYIDLNTLDNDIKESVSNVLSERDMDGKPDGNLDDVGKLAKWCILNGRQLLQNAKTGDIQRIRHALLDLKGATEEAAKEVEIAAQKIGLPPVGSL
jgi:hypothetical protein